MTTTNKLSNKLTLIKFVRNVQVRIKPEENSDQLTIDKLLMSLRFGSDSCSRAVCGEIRNSCRGPERRGVP